MYDNNQFHLYLVDNDIALTDKLSRYLAKYNLTATAMRTAEDLFDRVQERRPDLIVLDVVLSGMSGLQACQKLRGAGDTVPIILLTERDDESDRILGLEIGADDYVGKPFSCRELVARTRALLRRSWLNGESAKTGAKSIRVGDFTFTPHARSLRKGEEVRILNTVEHALLAELTAHARVPISRERLVAVSHVRSQAVLPRAIDAAVMRLRRLVEPEPAKPRFIQTVRGEGYMFVPQ